MSIITIETDITAEGIKFYNRFQKAFRNIVLAEIRE